MKGSSKSREDFRALFHRILHFANRGLPRIDFLKEVSRTLLEFSGCDEIEMRLVERRRLYRCQASRKQPRSQVFEVSPLGDSWRVEYPHAAAELSDFERLCWDLLRGEFTASPPHVSPSGSLYLSDTQRPIQIDLRDGADQRLKDLALNDLSRCRLVFPITGESGNFGLVLMGSERANHITADEVTFYESLGHNLGVALAHRRAQVALRERVKELTCLYGISRLVEQPDISIPQLLQGIVNLMPPAWLYPEIAQSRIALNGDDYRTENFEQGQHRQGAEIIVSGQKRGLVEVAYLEDRPELDEGPFLKEERSLIDTIAREVASFIERRQAEEERAKLQEQLRHADRLATIGQLAAGVAHELNEPLGNILGFAQLAQKDQGLPAQAAADVAKIIKASLYAREVIKKLMLFSRQVPSRKIEVDLNRVVEESLSLLQGRLTKSGVEVALSLEPQLPEVTADAAQLNQVLVNLIVNAAQAMPEGGKLSISTRSGSQSIGLGVEDTGSGMSPEVLKQIFIPFFTTKDVSQGTGLGLAVVHGIITAHGGTIQVSSEVGKGSKFTIEFPIRKEEA